MARPLKSEDERLSERIRFNVCRSDFLRAAQAAEKAGMTRAAYARQQFLSGRVIVKKTLQLDHATFDQLRRIGVNLNQLTRLAHRDEKLPPALSELCALIERFLMENIDGPESHQKGP